MSTTSGNEGLWLVEPLPGFRVTCPYIAHDPNCPRGPHPTRDCRCRVFRTKAAAYRYINVTKAEEQDQGEAG